VASLATPVQGDAEVIERLGVGRSRATRRWLFRLGILAAFVATVMVVLAWRSLANRENQPRYIVEPVEQGDLHETVSATGTLNPLDSVEVGSEVSGRVIKVHVDINDEVKAGQVLVEIDTETLSARVEEEGAQLRSARASVTTAKSTAEEAELKARRLRELHQKGLISDQELEAAEAASTRAKAGVTSANAAVAIAQNGVKTAQIGFGKALIKSPTDGIVLARSVEPGQTVNAGLQTPVLLTLARDITRMELKVDVDEADVGKVKDGLDATFVVDAYPKHKFSSKLVRLNNLPKSGTTVITYEGLLTVDNGERLLRPGMTATATLVTAEKKNVLSVPNAALRFVPSAGGEASAKTGGLSLPPIGGGPPGESTKPSRPLGSADPTKARGGNERVYVLEDGRAEPVAVVVGVTDGTRTEVSASELSAGMEVIVDVEEAPK
jgi:HlyD family secretion protein